MGHEKSKHRLVGVKLETWVAGVKCLERFEISAPQTAYVGLKMLLQ